MGHVQGSRIHGAYGAWGPWGLEGEDEAKDPSCQVRQGRGAHSPSPPTRYSQHPRRPCYHPPSPIHHVWYACMPNFDGITYFVCPVRRVRRVHRACATRPLYFLLATCTMCSLLAHPMAHTTCTVYAMPAMSIICLPKVCEVGCDASHEEGTEEKAAPPGVSEQAAPPNGSEWE